MRYLFITVALYLFAMPALADDLPDPPGKTPLPEADNWVIGTLGAGDIASLDELLEGDVFCQRKLAEGFALERGGLLMAEKKAALLGEYKIAYDELRALYSIDLKAWIMKEDIYKDELSQCQTALEKASKPPNFWTANKGIIGFILGVALGVGATVGIAYAIGGAN